MRGWPRLALACALWLVSAAAFAAALRFEIGAIDHPALQVQGLTFSLADDAGSAEIVVRRVAAAGHEWRDLRFGCPDLRIELPELRCAGGLLSVEGLFERIRVDFSTNVLRGDGRLRLVLPAGDRADLAWHADGRVVATLAAVDLARLGGWVPALDGFSPAGRFDGRIELRSATGAAPDIRIEGRVAEGSFASEDGLKAAEGLALVVSARLLEVRDAWDFSGDLHWTAGEAYVHPLYLTAGGTLMVAGRVDERLLELRRVSLMIDGVDAIEARARLALPEGRPESLGIAVAGADLAVVGPRFVAPVIAPARADALGFAGRVSAGVEIELGVLRAFDLSLDGVRFEDAGSALAFGPLSGIVPWREHEATLAQLAFDGGRWEALELGPFGLEARLHGNALDIERVTIPVLDGSVVLSDLALRRGGAGWSGSGAAVIEPISMSLLTAAVGLPSMSGVLSASLPGLRVSPGELALDGALVISVFDGYLRVTDLQVIEPFGVSSRLFSNVDARNLDLGQLTETFSFGGITGFIDIDIAGLELAHWRPVRFDAHVRSAPGRYPRRISQRAVQNIGALAGPGAGAALQRGVLSFFETFGYREIGLSCRLEGGVCLMGGIGDSTAGSYDIVRGGGIPALNVIGYNRRVNWDDLIDRLQRVIESNSAPVIR